MEVREMVLLLENEVLHTAKSTTLEEAPEF